MKFLSLIFVFLASNAFADVTSPLSKNDPLEKVARAIGTQLSDGNIASGTTYLWAGQLKRSAQFGKKEEFKALVVKGFTEVYKEELSQSVPKDAKLKVQVSHFVDGDGKKGDVYKMTTALIESNDYAPSEENRKTQARFLWAVLRKLPVSGQTLIGHVSVQVKDDDSSEAKSVQYFLLVNEDGKTVQFFTVEGSM